MTDADVKALIAEVQEYADRIHRWAFGDDSELADRAAVRFAVERITDALEAATATPAVDREALVQRVDGSPLDHFLRSFNGDEAGDIDYVFAEDGNTGWAMRGGNDVGSVLVKAFDALTASGILRDVRDVQAEALERYADERWGEVGPHRVAYNEELRMRERAQAIREARND